MKVSNIFQSVTAKGLKLTAEALRERDEQRYSEAYNEGYNRAYNKGIVNTISALLNEKLKDERILSILCEYWQIPKSEAEKLIVEEKINATIGVIEPHLRLQGFSPAEIDQFFEENNVLFQVEHNKDLWNLRESPDKLIKSIQKKNGKGSVQ